LTGQYENFAKENKGLFRMGAVDCDEIQTVCKKENILKFPTWRVYPAFPAPS
jgi:thioredoxin-like negative regulator of GroEL